MKKILAALAFTVLTLCAYAQATFVRTMPGYGNVAVFSANGEKMYGYDTTAVYLYNMDGTPWKTIDFPVISGYLANGVFAMSDNLFNSDNLVELVVSYGARVYPFFPRSQTILINETGTILQHIDTSNSGSVHYDQTNNTYMLFTYFFTNNYNTNTYSLTGTMPCGICGSLGSERLSSSGSRMTVGAPYPNPSSGIVQINYNLQTGTSGEIVFYNELGAMVKEQPVFSTSNSISINNSTFRPGSYNYNIVSGNNVSNTQTMIVK
jgi:hypothetical protein